MPKMSEWQNYGGLSVFDNSVAEPIVDGTPRVITAWQNAMATSAQVTSDPVINNHIVITDAGDYQLIFDVSMVGSNNRTFEIAINFNGSPALEADITVSNNQPRSVGAHGLVTLPAGATITLTQQITSGGGAGTLTIVDGQLSVVRLV